MEFYTTKKMVAIYAVLLFTLFGEQCPLYQNVLLLLRILDHENMKGKESKFTKDKCAALTYQPNEESVSLLHRGCIRMICLQGGPTCGYLIPEMD